MAIPLFCRMIITVALLVSIFLFIPGIEDLYSVRRFVQLFIIGLLVFSLAFNRSFFTDYGRGFTLILLASGLALLSSVLYANSEYYLADVFFLPFWLLAVLVLASWIRRANFTQLFKYVLVTLVLLEFLYALITLVFYQHLMRTEGALAEQIPWGYTNIRYWSHTVTWLLPLMPLALRQRMPALRSFWRPLVCLTAGMMVWMVLLSTARGTVLALAIATLVVGVLAGRQLMGWLQDMGRFALAGIGIWLILSWLVPMMVLDGEVTQRVLHFTSSGRIPLWLEAWQMSLENFPLGMGAQSWLTHEIITAEYLASPKLGHPHNMFLQWAAEYGWIYVIALVLFLFWALNLRYLHKYIRMAKHNDSVAPEALAALLVSFLAACLHAFFSAIFWAPASMLLGMVVCALLLAGVRGHKDNSLALSPQQLWLQRAVTAMVILVVLFWLFEVADYFQAVQADYDVGDNDDLRKPRFWLHNDFSR